MLGTDHFQEAILSKRLYLFPRLHRPPVPTEHKARNLWNFLCLRPDEVISLRDRILFGSVKIYPEHAEVSGADFHTLNQVIVISVLNTLCARVGRMSVMWGRPLIYDLFMFSLWAQHAKGVSLCLSAAWQEACQSEKKKSAKKKKEKVESQSH